MEPRLNTLWGNESYCRKIMLIAVQVPGNELHTENGCLRSDVKIRQRGSFDPLIFPILKPKFNPILGTTIVISASWGRMAKFMGTTFVYISTFVHFSGTLVIPNALYTATCFGVGILQ